MDNRGGDGAWWNKPLSEQILERSPSKAGKGNSARGRNPRLNPVPSGRKELPSLGRNPSRKPGVKANPSEKSPYTIAVPQVKTGKS
eukprot:CAMPEP_0118939986 /NCGR_PEP_ID=MMETSP1169-20130426/30333_1 /TAXON_ID=36882 /ORGANISM="Pyramimonas obovata, Strain CCMP722" /LENGTH=85 /DNA_ID=CAMNT_0006884375 /DNA_START=260 /DNA_END=513 /DNA_ORIENTATION=+